MASVPELVVLRLPDEEAASLLNVSPEQLLRRWVNLHLAKVHAFSTFVTLFSPVTTDAFNRHLPIQLCVMCSSVRAHVSAIFFQIATVVQLLQLLGQILSDCSRIVVRFDDS